MSIDSEIIIDRELEDFRDTIASDAGLESHDRIRQVLEIIQNRLFDADLRVATVLEDANVRSNVFRQTFKAQCGQSMRHYIQDRRVMAAMWLLNVEDIDITTIAYRVGYDDYRTFARAFKRYVGCTASEFRRRIPTTGSYA